MKTLLLAALLFSLPVVAADIKMLDIKSDVDGNQTATISIQALSDTTIQNVVYSNPMKPTQVWAMTSLNQNKVVIVEKKGVAVIEISAQTLSKNSFLFNIYFLYKYGLFGSDRRLKQLKMFYVAPSNLYQTMDVDTKKIITNAVFVARMEGDKQKGIERIDTY